MVSFSKKSKKAQKADLKQNLKISGKNHITTKTDDNFKEELLQAHNECRVKHNVPTAVWSDKLAKNAQQWADTIAKKGKLQHAHPNQRKGQGENIACAGGQPLGGKKATMMWYDEIKDYDFTSKPTYNPNCGHFTQVVWAESTEIGAGIATSKNGMHFVVARYSPAGNQLNTFEENIKPPSNKNVNDEDVIIPTSKQDVCESPNFDLDSADSINDNKNIKGEEEEDAPPSNMRTENETKQVDEDSRSLAKFEMREISEELQQPYERRTVEVTISTVPIKEAAYTQRKNEYLHPDQQYLVVHYRY